MSEVRAHEILSAAARSVFERWGGPLDPAMDAGDLIQEVLLAAMESRLFAPGGGGDL